MAFLVVAVVVVVPGTAWKGGIAHEGEAGRSRVVEAAIARPVAAIIAKDARNRRPRFDPLDRPPPYTKTIMLRPKDALRLIIMRFFFFSDPIGALALQPVAACVCVFSTLNRSFCSSTSSTPSVRADSSS